MDIKQETHFQTSKTRMNTAKKSLHWHRRVDQRFRDFDDFTAHVHDWDLDFRQLSAGESPAELLQFGRADFHVTRFYMEQAYDQRGATLSKFMTMGIIENGVEAVTTADGKLRQDDIICFPAGSEFSCVSRSKFKGYTLTIADSLVDEVAESTGLQRARIKLGMNMMFQRFSPDQISALRSQLCLISNSIKQIEESPDAADFIPDLEFELIRKLLSGNADSRKEKKQLLTSRKMVVLQRALDYIEANAHKPITVLELSKASGAGVRTLEYAFRDYFDVTPKAYLKSRRLIAVRRELRRSPNADTLIHEVAGRWGFWHMGQFAADYRRFFGELPSDTMNMRM